VVLICIVIVMSIFANQTPDFVLGQQIVQLIIFAIVLVLQAI